MFNGRRVDLARAEASAEHRRREDAAPRLSAAAPDLASLRLTFEMLRDGVPVGMSYARPIVVASAPAHFAIRCMEPRCDGRHDLTAAILDAIRQRLTKHHGQSTCNGIYNDTMCQLTLSYVCEATYRT